MVENLWSWEEDRCAPRPVPRFCCHLVYSSRVHVHVMVSSSLLAHGRDFACVVVVGVVVFCTFVRKVGLCGLFRW